MSSPQPLQELPAAQKIVQLLAGKCLAQAVSVAAELGIADLLTDTPKNVEEIAAVTSTHAPALYRLLRALANHGLFAEVEGRRFTMTPLARCLRNDAPDSIRNLARWMGSPLVWRALGELLHSVKTGGTGTQQAFGLTDPFAYFSDHPEQLQVFHDCTTDISRLNTPAIIEAYDFEPFHKIVDVGGSHGMLLSAILRRYPGPRGIVFDLPDAIEGARQAIVAGDLTGRVETVGGNFFESVPAGADAYILKQVIHDWDDTPAVVIPRNVRQAIQPDGRLLVIEFVVPPPNERSLAKLLDLNMLAVTGGREAPRSNSASCLLRPGSGSRPSIRRLGHSVSLRVWRQLLVKVRSPPGGDPVELWQPQPGCASQIDAGLGRARAPKLCPALLLPRQ